jgi:hypothetical protein
MNRMRWDRLARLALLVVTPLGMSACGSGGPRKVPAEGTVTFNGQPLATGQVQLQPEAAPAPDATTDPVPAPNGVIENGKFALGTQVDGDGAPPGRYKVAIYAYKTLQTRYGESITKSMIPDRYANPEKSGITVVIPPEGTRDITIALTK